MTRVRWLYEAWQLRLKDETSVQKTNRIGEVAFNAFRDLLCSILGTNIEPIAEQGPDGVTYRWPKPGEFTPLIYAIARPDYLKSAMDKAQDLMPNGVDPTTLEDTITEEDLEFFDELKIDEKKAFWESPEMKAQLDQFVIQQDPKTFFADQQQAKEQPRTKKKFEIFNEPPKK